MLRKGTVSAEFQVNHPKLCENCAFPKKLQTRKLGEITVFYEVVFSLLAHTVHYHRCIDAIIWFVNCQSNTDRYSKFSKNKNKH